MNNKRNSIIYDILASLSCARAVLLCCEDPSDETGWAQPHSQGSLVTRNPDVPKLCAGCGFIFQWSTLIGKTQNGAHVWLAKCRPTKLGKR